MSGAVRFGYERVWDLLASSARRGATVTIDGVTQSNARVEREAKRVAGRLLELGVQRGDRVVILGSNSHDWVACFFGTLMVGAICVPVPTKWKTREIEHVVSQVDPVVVFVQDEVAGKRIDEMLASALDKGDQAAAKEPSVISLGQGATSFIAIEKWLGEGDLREGAVSDAGRSVDGESIALIQFTSGSTGLPKGVMLSHRAFTNAAISGAERMGLDSHKRYLSPQPFYYTGGLTAGLLTAFGGGSSLWSQSVFDADACVDTLRSVPITHMGGVGPMYALMLESSGFDATSSRTLRMMRTTGTRTELLRFYSDFGARPTNAYGLTEAAANVTMPDWRDPLEVLFETNGRPLRGAGVRILDLEMQDVPNGETGQIFVGGNIMSGYWPGAVPDDDAEASSPVHDGWLETGDIGSLDETGRLRYLGRAKEVLRVKGHNVSPGEVETVLTDHPHVVQACVFGTTAEYMEDRLVAVVTVRTGDPGLVAELRDFCRAQIASYKVPAEIRVWDSLPLTPGMKVNRMETRQLFLESEGFIEST